MDGFLKKVKNKREEKLIFFKLGVFKILKESGFRYTKILNKSYFLKFEKTTYISVEFHSLKDFFKHYLEDNFKNFELPSEYDLEFIMDLYYSNNPVKIQYAREYLKLEEELTKQQIKNILIQN